MLYQITDYLNNSIKAFSDPMLLQEEVLRITKDAEESQSVLQWATTTVFGGFRYDSEKFSIIIIGQDDFYS